MDRRSWMTVAVTGLAGAIGAGLAGLAARVGWSGSRRSPDGEERWVELCHVDDVPADGPFEASFRFLRREGWYWQEVERRCFVSRVGDGLVVFSQTCTHLGCPVRWRKSSGTYSCPCHKGEFSSSGEVLGGPPPRPLDRLGHRVVDQRVEVREA